MILDTLKEIISDAMGSRLKINASDIKEETEFIADLHADSVDIALANRITKEDIAVTNDYGLASLILARGAKALGASGLIYTTENIDKLLFVRHVSREVRKAKKGRTKGVPPRSAEDDENFRKSLIKLIENGLA